jgi:hypothetical protein
VPRLLTRNGQPYEALGLDVPRAEAVAIAELERDALLLRAAEGGSCEPLWRDAAHHAQLIVLCIRDGRDREAARHMRHVAQRWKRAARCSGHPVPVGQDDGAGSALLMFGAIALGVTVYWWNVEGKRKRSRR